MTAGRFGMVVCPMLEDEAIYNIKQDIEEKTVYLVDTPYTETIIPKLKQHSVEYRKISQIDVLSEKVPKEGYSVIIWVMNMGLHEDPDILGFEVRNQIIQMRNCVDSILLYYGRCGRGLDGIEEWAAKNVKIPVSIFKNHDGTMCDDCICIPIGGTSNYLRLLRAYPGRLYFTPAMASNFEGFLASMELFNGLDTTNVEIMQMMLDMAGYETVLEVQTGLGDQENFKDNIDVFARRYGLNVKKLEDGWVSKDLTDMNYANAKTLLDRYMKETKEAAE